MPAQSNSVSSSLLSKFPNLLAYVTTKKHGPMGDANKRIQFFDSLHIEKDTVFDGLQVHGTDVIIVGDTTKPGIEADGFILPSQTKQFSYLTVSISDCTPVFFVDPITSTVGVVHAGWRGSLGGITTQLIAKMIDLGSKKEDIFVWIGPHIGGCCYSVDETRAYAFLKEYKDPRVVYETGGMKHVDIAVPILLQCLKMGIPRTHIDAKPWCTSCETNQFFSYRRDGKGTGGGMIGIIGWTHDARQ